jgi:hypothetical protein
VPSHHEALGVSISAFTPTISSYTPRGVLVDDSLAQKMDAYNHEIIADGGFWSASLVLSGPLTEMEDWFDNGIGRHIEVYNPALELIWAGFVNRVDLSAGSLSGTRGPLLDIGNRVSATYTPILDATTIPPVKGSQTVTLITEDTTSQGQYGIIEKIISAGEALDDGTTNEAEQKRDTYLQENAYPKTSEDVDLGRSSAPTVSLELMGYVHWLNVYTVNNTTTATVALSTKIEDALGDDPNGLFSTDYADIESNAFLVSRNEEADRTAWTVIQELVTVGDANDNRATFGVYKDQKAKYQIHDSDQSTKYQHRIASSEQQLETYGTGTLVRPWDAVPAEWVFFPDFLVGRTQSSDRRLDPRYMFIESVRYTHPYGLQLQGGATETLPQMLSKGGMFY